MSCMLSCPAVLQMSFNRYHSLTPSPSHSVICHLQVVSMALHSESVKRLGLMYREEDEVANTICAMFGVKRVGRLPTRFGRRHAIAFGELTDDPTFHSTQGSAFRGVWIDVHKGSPAYEHLKTEKAYRIGKHRTTIIPCPSRSTMFDLIKGRNV